jgi:hypothetical protein
VVADFVHGSLRPGISAHGFEAGAVDIAYSGGFLDDVRPRLEELRAQIIAGQIAVPCIPADRMELAAELGIEPSCRR